MTYSPTEKFAVYLDSKGTILDDKDLGYLIRLIKRRNYVQILYFFDIEVLLDCLEFFEEENKFKVCGEIVDTIKKENKLTGKNYPTKREYE